MASASLGGDGEDILFSRKGAVVQYRMAAFSQFLGCHAGSICRRKIRLTPTIQMWVKPMKG